MSSSGKKQMFSFSSGASAASLAGGGRLTCQDAGRDGEASGTGHAPAAHDGPGARRCSPALEDGMEAALDCLGSQLIPGLANLEKRFLDPLTSDPRCV